MAKVDQGDSTAQAPATLLFPEIITPAPTLGAPTESRVIPPNTAVALTQMDVPSPRARVQAAKKAREKAEGRLLREASAFCQRIVRDPEYRRRIKQDALAGALDPGIEKMIWAYAYGQPRKVVEHQGEVKGAGMTVIKKVIVRKSA